MFSLPGAIGPAKAAPGLETTRRFPRMVARRVLRAQGAISDTGGVVQPPRSSRSDEGGAGARDNPAEPSRTTPFTGPGKIPMTVKFGPGIEFETLNEEYLFQIHNQTQVEGRFYQQANQNPGAGGFDVPRERFIIAGRLSKPIEYDASLESAYGTVNLLNAFMNWHYDDRFMVKFGRLQGPLSLRILCHLEHRPASARTVDVRG